MQQLEQQNERMREALIKMRDLASHDKMQLTELQKEVATLAQGSNAAKQLSDDQLAQLAEREDKLKAELAELQKNREELALAVDEGARARYERLTRSKGENVVVDGALGLTSMAQLRG